MAKHHIEMTVNGDAHARLVRGQPANAARFAMPERSTAVRTARCTAVACGWWRRCSPVRASV